MDNKVRIVCDVPADVVKDIDMVCDILGLTRASYFRMILYQDLNNRKLVNNN